MKLLPVVRTPCKKVPSANQPSPTLVAQCQRAFAAGVPAKKVIAAIRDVLDEHRAIAGLSKRRGRARGGGQSSKAKGRKAVQVVRDLLLATYDFEEDDVLVKATSMGGCDLHLSPKAQHAFPFAIEVKNVEKLSIWAALAQAQVNATPKNQPAVVFFKRAGSPMYVALRADAFLSRVRR
jgi:hypothetical protein